ncbi:hypothetical protein LCGC14_0747290 [marine sediment metagenome]|uniref:Uncharacterized protein n=1 Tax=marine sediment metagenome TaxID=412755 RepID=A0A0F9Q966_9ZZZZ
MAVTFAGGFGEQLGGLAGDLGKVGQLKLLREQASAKTKAANIKRADGFIKQALDILAAGGTLAPSFMKSMVQTAIKLNPDERLKYEAVGKSLLGIPAQGSPEDLERQAAEAAASREPIPEAAERAGAITEEQQAATPGAGKRLFQGTTAEGKEQEFVVDLENNTVTPVGPSGIPLSVQATKVEDLVGGQGTIKKLREQETATRVVLGDIQRMKQQLLEGKTFTSVVSGAVRSVNSLVGTALQASAALGFDDRNKLNPEQYDLEGFFGEEAAKSAAFKSNIVKLAYAIARSAEPGGRLAETDVENALKQLGTDSGDKAVIAATLDEVASGAVRGFKAAFTTVDRQSPGSFGEFPPDFADLLKPSGATDDSQELPEGIPPGSKLLDVKTKDGLPVYETPDGERLVVF